MSAEHLRQHAIAIMAVYGIAAHGLSTQEALDLAEQVGADPKAADLQTTREVFAYYDRVLHLKRTGPVTGRG